MLGTGAGPHPFSRKACGFFMTVIVNGKAMEVPEGSSVEDLLVRLKVRREFTAVALNREVTQRARYAETRLSDGDRVEIVHPMGGG
jgi:sulfur carrier protein